MKNKDFDELPFELEKRSKKSSKTLIWVYGAIFVMSILLMLSWLSENRRRVGELYKQLNTKDQEFKKEKTKNGETVALQEQRILELNKENLKLIKTINNFKTVQGQVKVQTNTIIKEVKVPYAVEVKQYIDTFKGEVYVRLPLPFEQSDSFFGIKGVVGIDGLEIDSLSIPNELTITTGKIDGGFFKKDKYAVEIVSSNPNVDITKVNNTQFKPKTRFYKKWWFGFGLGAIAMLIL